MMYSRAMRSGSRLVAGAVLVLTSGCTSGEKVARTAAEKVESTTSALTSSANLRLQELTSACVANQVFDTFTVKNNGTTSIPLSNITMKIWVNDTSSSNMAPQINYGG